MRPEGRFQGSSRCPPKPRPPTKTNLSPFHPSPPLALSLTRSLSLSLSLSLSIPLDHPMEKRETGVETAPKWPPLPSMFQTMEHFRTWCGRRANGWTILSIMRLSLETIIYIAWLYIRIYIYIFGERYIWIKVVIRRAFDYSHFYISTFFLKIHPNR